MDSTQHQEDVDEAWPVLCNTLKGYYTSLSRVLCGFPPPSQSSIQSHTTTSRHPSSPRSGEQECFTSQSEMDVQSVQPRKREVIWPFLLDGEEEEEEVSTSDNVESENAESETEGERPRRVISELQEPSPSQSPSPRSQTQSPAFSQASSHYSMDPPSPSISQGSGSDYICSPHPSPPLTQAGNFTSSHNTDELSMPWQVPELNELKRIYSELGLKGEEIGEEEYEKIAKAMNDFYWWQMQIPMVRKPREYGVGNMRMGVERCKGKGYWGFFLRVV